MQKYKFVGPGAGVPGLPHEITQAEIEQLNETQFDEWHAALSSGLYVEVTDAKPVRKSKSTTTDQTPSEGA